MGNTVNDLEMIWLCPEMGWYPLFFKISNETSRGFDLSNRVRAGGSSKSTVLFGLRLWINKIGVNCFHDHKNTLIIIIIGFKSFHAIDINSTPLRVLFNSLNLPTVQTRAFIFFPSPLGIDQTRHHLISFLFIRHTPLERR